MTTDADDELLQRVLLGELDADSREVRERASANPEFAEELAAMTQLVEALADDAREERATLELAENAAQGPDSGSATGTSAPAGRGPFMLVGSLIAAAAAVVLWIALGGSGEDAANAGDPSGSVLLGKTLELHTPAADARVAAGELEFAWQLDPQPAGTTYHLRVWNTDVADAPVLERRNLEAARYTPDEAERSRLSGSIRWEVQAIASDGSTLVRRDATAVVGAP